MHVTQEYNGPRAKQFPFVENPATVLLAPVRLDEADWVWWSYDGILLGGLKINSGQPDAKGEISVPVPYLPTPIPRSWGRKEFGVVIEYEAEVPDAHFSFRLHYGCGDPSELRKGESQFFQGVTGKKTRLKFALDESFIYRNELFRCTLEIVRKTPAPILVYGCWLEIGVEP